MGLLERVLELSLSGFMNPLKAYKCTNCLMMGFLRPKTMIRPGVEIDTMTGDYGTTPTLNVCITCYDTPSGIVSDNASHKRLADAEYQVDKVA